jgi:hypothetical protein
MSPFDYVNEILQGKKQLIIDEASEKAYVPFLTNRALSNHLDCIMYANEMNRLHIVDSKLQNDFLLNTVRSKKRPFAKWAKHIENDDLECIQKMYGLSKIKAREAIRLLSDEQIQKLKEQTDTGGLRK